MSLRCGGLSAVSHFAGRRASHTGGAYCLPESTGANTKKQKAGAGICHGKSEETRDGSIQRKIWQS